ncbi:hypothetical protein [Sphingomonas sp. MS122]|uniref:hypothetical protein n=1 Tax=Sphingomonas sp. MS122 TaxID=3412683 RepID=UPI003C2AB217
MPRLIDPGEADPIALDDLTDALDSTPFDPHDEESFAALGPLLARLGRNRDFLADLAIDELKLRCARQSAANGYGPQVFLLRPPNGRYVIRANFWPAAQDAVVQASGTAPFFYGLPHDHNFPLETHPLTCPPRVSLQTFTDATFAADLVRLLRHQSPATAKPPAASRLGLQCRSSTH